MNSVVQHKIVKILFPLTKNPNIPTKYGETPIFKAALFGNKEIIEILAPLTDYPKAPKENGRIPIEIARNSQNTEYLNLLRILHSIETGNCINQKINS